MAPAGLGARRRRPRREGGATAQLWASPGAESFRLPWAPAPTPTPWAAPPGSALSGSAPPPGSPPPPSPCPAPPRPGSSPLPRPLPQVRLGSTLARGPLLRPDLRSRPRRRSPLTTPDPAVHLVRVSPGPRPGAAQSGSAPPLLSAPPPAPPRPRPVPGRPLGGALRRPDALRSRFSVLSSRGAELPGDPSPPPQTVPLSRGLEMKTWKDVKDPTSFTSQNRRSRSRSWSRKKSQKCNAGIHGGWFGTVNLSQASRLSFCLSLRLQPSPGHQKPYPGRRKTGTPVPPPQLGV
uniref:proline-rich protein 2-like n=1 Tax=Panthera onca TaxID=9690 RepID=UPI00295389D6|nr:proline-rich protein 2-like [Panthera onca]